MQDLLNSLVAPDACLTVDQLAAGRDVTYRRLCAELAAAYKAGYVTRADRGCYCLTLEGRAAQKTGVMHEAGAARPPPRGGASWKDTDRTRIWTGIRRLTPTSPAMRRVLLNLYRGLEPFGHLHGRSMHGAAGQTHRALRRRGWCTGPWDEFRLTDAGREQAAFEEAHRG